MDPNELLKTKELLLFRYYFMIQNELVGIPRSFVAHDLLPIAGEEPGNMPTARRLRHDYRGHAWARTRCPWYQPASRTRNRLSRRPERGSQYFGAIDARKNRLKLPMYAIPAIGREEEGFGLPVVLWQTLPFPTFAFTCCGESSVGHDRLGWRGTKLLKKQRPRT